MANFSDIATSLRVTTMLPLDHKRFCMSEAILSDLGVDNNLAFTYYDNLKVFCWGEKSEWVWREVLPGEENTGLLPLDYTYPNGVTYPTPGPGYANKKYNFKQLVEGTDTKIIAGANMIVTGDGSSTSPYVITNNYVYVPPAPDLSPLQKIDEGFGFGIIIRGRNPANYGVIGTNAIDLSTNNVASTTHGATGVHSFAAGLNLTSSGPSSVTLGAYCVNSGATAFVAGNSNNNSASDSTVLGKNNVVSGKGNTVLGISNNVAGAGITVVGKAANIISTSLSDWNNTVTKPMFLVGNGTVDNINNSVITRSDAFIVRQDGTVEAPSLSIGLITAGIPRTLVTKEYLQNQLVGVSRPYKVYSAILSQTGTNAPTIAGGIPLENTLDGNITWAYLGPGVYYGTLSSGVFTANKTGIIIGNQTSVPITGVRNSDSQVYILTNSTNSVLSNVLVEIRVYN